MATKNVLISFSDSSTDAIYLRPLPQNEESKLWKEKDYITLEGDELMKIFLLNLSSRLQTAQMFIKGSIDAIKRCRSYEPNRSKLCDVDAVCPQNEKGYITLKGGELMNLIFHDISSRLQIVQKLMKESTANSSERFGFEVVDVPKKSWSQKLNQQIKEFWLSQKLQALVDYLKALFTKSKCKDLQSDKHEKPADGFVLKNMNANMDERGSKKHTRRSSKVSPSFSSSAAEVGMAIEEAICYCQELLKKLEIQEKTAVGKTEPNGNK